ncbi:TonB-dependent receptor [Rurimicrobium arvi]|uniref:TonB-dependent receptor plug domain-containing protein n=1 Tax=Rurimicrobium arvi TaxID=2049916 RepID=A0ABP8MQT7_9BACT
MGFSALYRNIIIAVLPVLCAYSWNSRAQTKELHEVKVKHRRKAASGSPDVKLQGFAPGMQQLSVDSQWQQQYRMQQLSQLLTQQFSVFVKSYGINSLATLNFRGASAAQSQVYWNGVPLNNASFGATDVSLLTVNQFDKIHLLYGGSSALTGSGNVGGALLLDNDLHTSDSLRSSTSVGLEWGSYRSGRINLRQSFSGKRWSISANLNAQRADNNFHYTNSANQDVQMTHAALRSASGMLNVLYQLSDYSSIKAAFWLIDYKREIPPALFEAASVKLQRDHAYRGMLQWQHSRSAGTFYSKLALSVEQMHYTDSAAALDTRNQVVQLYQETGWKRALSEHQNLLLFVPVNISGTHPERDSQSRYQYRIAIAAAYQLGLFREKARLSVAARTEQINERTVFLPGINGSFQAFSFLTLKANLQRSFRAPTLNELFYNPGGNPALKPEYGWSADAGYELLVPAGRRVALKHELALFDRRIHDWVLWFGGSVWTPHNIATVHSRGLETVNTLTVQLPRYWRLWLGLNTSFVLATTVESYLPGDGSIGKQIPYTPRYNGQGNIGCSWKQFSCNYNHTYTGYRFVTVDESQFLEPFQTGNIYLSYRQPVSTVVLTCSAGMNNIWNSTYQVVNARPMPGRNWNFGLSVSL